MLSRLPLLVAGDRVICESVGSNEPRIIELLPRTSLLARPDRRGERKPLAANLTHLAIVSACQPGLDSLLTDQFCVAAECAGIDALVVINKSDLLDAAAHKEAERWLGTYAELGYPTALIDTQSNAGMAPLLEQLGGRVVTLVGASGVGKSSIIRCLLPDREVRIGALSAASGLGAHTTSVTCWYPLEDDAAIIDSPGVRQFPVSHLKPADLRDGYREIAAISARCRFGNCAHQVEPGCAVREAVASGEMAAWRYANYCTLSGKRSAEAGPYTQP